MTDSSLLNLSYHSAGKFATGPPSRAINMRIKITQPSGAATPRNSDAHKRIAVPKAFCVLWEHPRPSPKSGKTCRSDTRPGDVCERAERSEGSDTTPHPKRPVFRRVSRCVRSFSESRVCTRFRSEGKRGPFVREVEKRDEKRFETELVPVTFCRYLRERFWTKSRTLQEGFSGGEGRSILVQTGYNLSS